MTARICGNCIHARWAGHDGECCHPIMERPVNGQIARPFVRAPYGKKCKLFEEKKQ